MDNNDKTIKKRPIGYNKATHRYCACCGKLLPRDDFDPHGKNKLQQVCRHCKAIVKYGSSIKSYTTQEILRELRDRGVKGKFTYTRVETIEL